MAEPLRVLDTSVIVRYVTADDPVKTARAGQLVESSSPIGVTTVALLEASYVLQKVYGHERARVAEALIGLVTRENAVGVGVDLGKVAARLALCRPSGTVSFGDALLAATGASFGVNEAYTFDEKLDRSGLTTLVL
jgi:predicted nucleic acid-binding protein